MRNDFRLVTALVIFLILILLSSRNWPQKYKKLSFYNPLDVDRELPFPEAGQGSSICSLTALFGPYFALVLLLGIPALLGLTFGSILGLILIWIHCTKSQLDTFQHMILSRFMVGNSPHALLIVISLTQLGFATSEMFILKDIASIGFSLDPEHSNMFTISLALIGYLYVIDGGYGAIYRTDFVQYIFILVMCIALVTAVLHISSGKPQLLSPSVSFQICGQLSRVFHTKYCSVSLQQAYSPLHLLYLHQIFGKEY